METLLIILAVAAGCWEVIARPIPTVNNWSGTAIILKVLNFLVNFFIVKQFAKNKKITNEPD